MSASQIQSLITIFYYYVKFRLTSQGYTGSPEGVLWANLRCPKEPLGMAGIGVSFTGRMPFLSPNQQLQSTEGVYILLFTFETLVSNTNLFVGHTKCFHHLHV